MFMVRTNAVRRGRRNVQQKGGSSEPRNRRRADVVGAANLGQGFLAPVAALDRFALLVRGELRRTAHFHATGHGSRPAFTCPRADKIAFKLRQPAQHGQHQPPVRGRCVGPCVAQGSEPGLAVGDRRQRIQQVAGRAGQPVKPRHHHHVARREPVEQPAQSAPGRSWLRSPLRGTPCCIRPWSVAALARQRSGRPSIPVHTRISCLTYGGNLCKGKALWNQWLKKFA